MRAFYSHVACKMVITRMSVRVLSMSVMGDVFIGSEAITAGRGQARELQRWYQPCSAVCTSRALSAPHFGIARLAPG